MDQRSAVLSELGHRAGEAGMATISPDDLDQLLRAGLAAGVRPVLLSVLADVRAPEVARLRALGKALAVLDRPAPVTPRRVLDYVLASPSA